MTRLRGLKPLRRGVGPRASIHLRTSLAKMMDAGSSPADALRLFDIATRQSGRHQRARLPIKIVIQVASGTGSPSMVRDLNLQADNAASTASSQPAEPLLPVSLLSFSFPSRPTRKATLVPPSLLGFG